MIKTDSPFVRLERSCRGPTSSPFSSPTITFAPPVEFSCTSTKPCILPLLSALSTKVKWACSQLASLLPSQLFSLSLLVLSRPGCVVRGTLGCPDGVFGTQKGCGRGKRAEGGLRYKGPVLGARFRVFKARCTTRTRLGVPPKGTTHVCVTSAKVSNYHVSKNPSMLIAVWKSVRSNHSSLCTLQV